MEEIMLYDISGNLYYKKDRNGNELKYTYDTDDNLINVLNASRQSKGRNRFIQPDFSESYEYNADGTLKKAISKGILYTYQYDKQGRQIEKWQNGKMVLQYAYDKNGNMVCQKDISGKQTAYTFDDIGRIQTVIDDGEKAVQYYYNDDSTLQKICYGNGITTEYSYNKDQSVVSLMTAKKDGTLITKNTYAYDENGNQIQKTEKGIKTTYAYDSLNQIKTVVYDEKVTELFDYDAVGNRIKRTLQGKEENYYYNNKNQLLQIDKENDTIFYKYDNQGNTLEQTSSKGTTTYQYDIYNRTIQVTTENGDVIKNKYDPLGFRYKKEVNGETHNYIFDGWSITAETNKDGELKSREVRGYGLVKKETNNKQYYYHQNEHGDITHLTNTDSEVENYYQYDVFGNIREQQENVENVFKYAGEQLDNETQQYYLRARFYNPVIARFTQEDVYRGDGLNLYVYVVNNPLLWFDASGHKKQCSSDELTPEEYQRNKEELKRMYQDFVEKKHESFRAKNYESSENLIEYIDSKKGIVIRELEFGKFGKLKNETGDNLTGHHMPSADYMKQKFNISQLDSYAMHLEQPKIGGGRHRRTFSYGRMDADIRKRYFNLNARDMLAFDLWDARRVLKEDGLWNNDARKAFSDYIKAYEEAYPEIFKKGGK